MQSIIWTDPALVNKQTRCSRLGRNGNTSGLPGNGRYVITTQTRLSPTQQNTLPRCATPHTANDVLINYPEGPQYVQSICRVYPWISDTCAGSCGHVSFCASPLSQDPGFDTLCTRSHVMRLMISDTLTTLAIAITTFGEVWSHSQNMSDVVAIVALPPPPARSGPHCAAHSQPCSALPLSFKLPPAAIWSWRHRFRWLCKRNITLILAWGPLPACCCRKSFACFASPLALKMWAESFTDTSPAHPSL
jgi:hypothetical protein